MFSLKRSKPLPIQALRPFPSLCIIAIPISLNNVLFITDRHPKDICRSFAHELVHHHQNERGDLNMGDASQATYAQDDPHMRKMEMEAYLKGNMLFRDWEDKVKNKN